VRRASRFQGASELPYSLTELQVHATDRLLVDEVPHTLPTPAPPRGAGAVVSRPDCTMALRDCATVGTGRSSAAAISARVAGPFWRRYPMIPARTRLPRALMGSSSHSLHPPGATFAGLTMVPILSRHCARPGPLSGCLDYSLPKVYVYNIHLHKMRLREMPR